MRRRYNACSSSYEPSSKRWRATSRRSRMAEPAIPGDEAERLRDLHRLQVLDTPAEERFDRITRLTRRLLGVPIALISLIDADRQWVKSRQGIDTTQAPRGISFCG